MLWPGWRRQYGVAVAILALVALAFTILTAGAGEAFRDSGQVAVTPALEEHARLGGQLRIVMIAFTGAIVFIVSWDRLRSRAEATTKGAVTTRRALLEGGLRAAIAVLAIFALVWLVRTGHEGAKATWPPLSVIPPSRSISTS
jgi:hypothetical protein